MHEKLRSPAPARYRFHKLREQIRVIRVIRVILGLFGSEQGFQGFLESSGFRSEQPGHRGNLGRKPSSSPARASQLALTTVLSVQGQIVHKPFS